MALSPHSRIGRDISLDLDVVTVGPSRTVVSVSAVNGTVRDVLVTLIAALGTRVIRVAAGTRASAVTVLPIALNDDDSLQVGVRHA